MTRDVDPEELFTPIAPTYERASALLSLGLEGGWRRRLVDVAEARADDLYLDVATGTGLVARELRRSAGCRVIGIDITAGMLASADRSDGIRFVQGRAERLPFPDATFDGLTFTYLLRYVDDPTATMRELARVVRPGGRIAMLEFFRPRSLPLRVGWWLFTRLALPVLGSLVSRDWRAIGRFLGRSIDRFYDRHSIESIWQGAGIEDVRTEELFLGSAVVAYGRAGPRSETWSGSDEPVSGPAFYALPSGGWRDYVTLLHPPYTLWHLSYVVLGAALAPTLQLDRLAGTLVAFFLALGIGIHALDELNGRPLRTRIPAGVLRAFAIAGLGGAVALGLAATTILGPGLLAFMAVGVVLALSYPLELARGRLHSDLWFALGWGAFPVLTAAWVGGGITVAALAGAAYAVALSYAQRALSTWVRMLRRRAELVSGEVRMADGERLTLDRDRLIAAPETALRWLTVVAVLVAGAALAVRLV